MDTCAALKLLKQKSTGLMSTDANCQFLKENDTHPTIKRIAPIPALARGHPTKLFKRLYPAFKNQIGSCHGDVGIKPITEQFDIAREKTQRDQEENRKAD